MKKTAVVLILTAAFNVWAAQFSAAPLFTGVQLNISVPSGFNNYIERQSVTPVSEKFAAYGSDKPSFIYSAGFSASFASVFTGENAYRNYFVNLFLEKRYREVVSLYPEYEEKLTFEKNIEEVKLLFAVSLINLGDEKGDDILKEICLENGSFSAIACDKYAQLHWDKKDYQTLILLNKKKIAPPLRFFRRCAFKSEAGESAGSQTPLGRKPRYDLLYSGF
jgi:hypothetical protein